MQLSGVPWARIGEQVGHDDITTTSRVYMHVVADEREVDYRVSLLGRTVTPGAIDLADETTRVDVVLADHPKAAQDEREEWDGG